MFVDHGVIDGAEHDLNVKNHVSYLSDVILGGAPVLYFSACVPALNCSKMRLLLSDSLCTRNICSNLSKF